MPNYSAFLLTYAGFSGIKIAWTGNEARPIKHRKDGDYGMKIPRLFKLTVKFLGFKLKLTIKF